MKNILLYWGWDADLIMVPDYIADNLSMYQKKIDKWISNKDNNNENIIENVNEKASFIKKRICAF